MSTETLQVLLVDDDEDHIELIHRAFVPHGNKYNISTASTLAEAQKLLKKTTPNLILADFLLPDGEGTELLPGDVEKRTFPIIILTGHGDEKVAAAAIKAGAMDYIVKSDDTFADMLHIVERSLREWQQIIKRKQTEETLRQSEHIVASSTDMLALLDKEFVYITANLAYLDAFNKTGDEVVGHSVAEVFGEKFFDEIIRPNAERCLAGEEINYQLWFDFPSYGLKYMDIHYYPYITIDNEIVGYVVNGRNITEHKQAEEELRKKFEEIKSMNRLMVGRELKMEELRKEIKHLKEELAALKVDGE